MRKYRELSASNIFIQYEHDEEITKYYSSYCDARIIWGGNQTINEIRNFKIHEKARDITFPDRYSLAIIDGKKVLNLNENKLNSLINNFYNDTYFMDQNACSSPHLIIWLGTTKENESAKEKFWKELFKVVKEKYLLEPVNVIDKYTSICEDLIKYNFIDNFKNYENLIYRIHVSKLDKNVHQLNNKFGYFYEFDCNNLDKIKHSITQKFQTLAYFGFTKKELTDFVVVNNLKGIDRVVPIGSSHDIGFVWDGYNIEKQLTRVIEVY